MELCSDRFTALKPSFHCGTQLSAKHHCTYLHEGHFVANLNNIKYNYLNWVGNYIQKLGYGCDKSL